MARLAQVLIPTLAVLLKQDGVRGLGGRSKAYNHGKGAYDSTSDSSSDAYSSSSRGESGASSSDNYSENESPSESPSGSIDPDVKASLRHYMKNGKVCKLGPSCVYLLGPEYVYHCM